MEGHRRVGVVTGRRAREMVPFNYSVIKGLSFRVMRKRILEEVNIVCSMRGCGFPIKQQTLIMPSHHSKILEPGDSSACISGKVCPAYLAVELEEKLAELEGLQGQWKFSTRVVTQSMWRIREGDEQQDPKRS